MKIIFDQFSQPFRNYPEELQMFSLTEMDTKKNLNLNTTCNTADANRLKVNKILHQDHRKEL